MRRMEDQEICKNLAYTAIKYVGREEDQDCAGGIERMKMLEFSNKEPMDGGTKL